MPPVDKARFNFGLTVFASTKDFSGLLGGSALRNLMIQVVQTGKQENIALGTQIFCTACGASGTPRNPFPTVDVVIFRPEQGILLIRRKNPPPGWALPGGFIDYGESAEQAAVREVLEETGLRVQLTGLIGVYSDPGRDPRFHTLSVVYAARVEETACPTAGDDALEAEFFPVRALPECVAFDHRKIIADFIKQHGGAYGDQTSS
jgi:8-oxo-dGTP diphosphatase